MIGIRHDGSGKKSAYAGRFVVVTTIVLLLICSVSAEKELYEIKGETIVSVASDGATYAAKSGTVSLKTFIDGTQFIPAESSSDKKSSVKFSSGEKTFYILPDPQVVQEYVFDDSERLKDTVYLKTERALSYKMTIPDGAYLSLLDDGSIKVNNPAVNEVEYGYIVMEKPFGWDNANQKISGFQYEIGKEGNISIKIPKIGDDGKSLQYPIAVDPIIDQRYYLKALLHGNLESADSFSTSVIRDSSTEAHMPALDVASTGSGLDTTNVKFGNASIFLKNAGTGHPVAVNMTDSDDWTLGSNNFTICTWVWQNNFTSQNFYIQQQGTDLNKFSLSCPGYVSGTISWYAKRGASAEGATGALSESAIAAAEAGWNRYCAIKNGSTISIYMNSTLLGSGTSTLTKTDLSGPASFGKDDMTYFNLAGKYYDEIVFVNGVGLPIDSPLLTSEWPLYANATPNYGYADDNSTVALLHMNGVDNGINFTDEVGNRTWTRTTAITHSNSSKFGTAGYFTGTGSSITTTYEPAFDMGSGDFTIDGWVKFNDDINSDAWLIYSGTYPVAWLARVTKSAMLLYGHNTGGWTTEATATLSSNIGQFYHFAIVRNGTNVLFFRDGTLIETDTIPSGYTYNAEGNSTILLGYNVSMDEVRYTKGLARWTANFTPPTYAYELTQPAFTMSPTESGTVPVTVTFNSSTPDDVWTHNDWYWDFGDGSTGTGRNTTHTYTTTGSYSATLQTFNNNMTAVSAATVFKPGAPVISIVISPNSGTAALLTETTITVSNTTPITGWGFDYGDGYSDTESPALVSGSGTSTVWKKTHVFANYGYFNYSINVTNSIGTDYANDYVTVSTNQNPPQVQYTPSEFRFKVLNHLGTPVAGATVTAKYVESTLPTAVTYLEKLYGIDEEIAIQMLSTNITMAGSTGTDGGIVFTMHPSLKYNITATGEGSTVSSEIWPRDLDNTIWLPMNKTTNVYEEVNVSLTLTEPNTSYFTMGTNFQDTAGHTSSLLFYVNTSNGTPVYQTTAVPSTANVTLNYTVANVRGDAYYWGVRCTRSDGNVSLDRGVTAKGPNGVLVDLGIPTTPLNWYPWIALCILFLLTALASKINIRFIALIMPMMGAIFWWWGWMSGTYLASVIPFCAALGCVYYMKGSLRENYGVGGPGSLLMTIIVFLMLFQMTVGFVNSLGVFQQQAVLPDNGFNNVGLTDIQTGVEGFAGVNDQLQAANEFTNLSWTVVKTLLSMIGAALLISIFLIEMFPYVPAGFFVILQGGIYVLYILFVIKVIGRSGPESDL